MFMFDRCGARAVKSTWVVLLLALGAASCGQSDENRVLEGPADMADASEASKSGRIELHLLSQTSSGNTYRLRDATITITGSAHTEVFQTESDPSRTKLSASVPAGQYQISLGTGWRLERVAPTTKPSVKSRLLSPNPDTFQVTANATVEVPLRFEAEGEATEIASGFDVVLQVEETGAGGSNGSGGSTGSGGSSGHGGAGHGGTAGNGGAAGSAGSGGTSGGPECGNGVREGDEECDGADSATGLQCDSSCQYVECGDGVKEGDEDCDDGNIQNNDGCSASCEIETGGGQTCEECTEMHCDDLVAACGEAVNGTKCTDLESCVMTSGCAQGATEWQNVVQGCICGTFQALDCAGGAADGPCLAQARLSASLTASPAGVLNTLVRIENPDYAGGDYRLIAMCQLENCAEACTHF